jgi:hypothetical protein
MDLLNAMPDRGPSTNLTLERYEKEKKRYTHDSDVAQADAARMDEKANHVEDQALRFDFGEGLLEIGLVLTSPEQRPSLFSGPEASDLRQNPSRAAVRCKKPDSKDQSRANGGRL